MKYKTIKTDKKITKETKLLCLRNNLDYRKWLEEKIKNSIFNILQGNKDNFKEMQFNLEWNTSVCFYIDKDLDYKLRKFCKEENITQQEVISTILLEELLKEGVNIEKLTGVYD